MSKFILMASLALALSACGTPAPSADTPKGTDANNTASGSISTDTSVSTDISADASVDVSADASIAIEAKNLSRTQFISAMTCAEGKADAGKKSIFTGQKTVFSSAGSEASFNTVMGLGGGGQYVIYKEAVALGCPG